jgi:hypothetical protein
MAAIAWHGKQFSDEVVAEFFPLIEQYGTIREIREESGQLWHCGTLVRNDRAARAGSSACVPLDGAPGSIREVDRQGCNEGIRN